MIESGNKSCSFMYLSKESAVVMLLPNNHPYLLKAHYNAYLTSTCMVCCTSALGFSRLDLDNFGNCLLKGRYRTFF